MVRNLKIMLGSVLVIFILAGAAAALVPGSVKGLEKDEKFYVDEGAHFELPYEEWSSFGTLKTDDGRILTYTEIFHKAGVSYIHARNGYNSLRRPDGRYDYRSFGQGLIKGLTGNALRDNLEKHPDDSFYKETLAALEADKSEHFQLLKEGDYPLHRGRMFMKFGENRLERMNKLKFTYELNANTWAGLLSIRLNAKHPPMIFDSEHPRIVSAKVNRDLGQLGALVSYTFSDIEATGTIMLDGRPVRVSGNVWLEHIWGQPDGMAMAKTIIIYQHLRNGSSFIIAQYYNMNGTLENNNFIFVKPDGLTDYKNASSLKPIGSWTSPVSSIIYETGWALKGKAVSGRVEAAAGAENSEIMLEQGVGAFWFGPCNFKGTVYGKKLEGQGFCRVVSPDTTPYKPR